jgi:hypothetical protein
MEILSPDVHTNLSIKMWSKNINSFTRLSKFLLSLFPLPRKSWLRDNIFEELPHQVSWKSHNGYNRWHYVPDRRTGGWTLCSHKAFYYFVWRPNKQMQWYGFLHMAPIISKGNIRQNVAKLSPWSWTILDKTATQVVKKSATFCETNIYYCSRKWPTVIWGFRRDADLISNLLIMQTLWHAISLIYIPMLSCFL